MWIKQANREYISCFMEAVIVGDGSIHKGDGHTVPKLGFDLALHIGNLTFGNIGVPERLQFTVVGPAANEVSRLHAIGRELKRSIVVSATFARQLPIEWTSLGEYELRGIAGRREVFAPPEHLVLPERRPVRADTRLRA